MKKNTVNISLKKYNALKDFKNKVSDGAVLVVEGGGYNYKRWKSFWSESEAIQHIADENKALEKKVSELEDTLRNSVKIRKDMNYFQYRRFMKSINKK